MNHDLDHPCRQTCSGWKQGFERGAEPMRGALKEIDRLHRVIAKELTEDDSLGAEYTYVVALKTENKKLRDALKRIAEWTHEPGTAKEAKAALE